jgi:hypothetical protein
MASAKKQSFGGLVAATIGILLVAVTIILPAPASWQGSWEGFHVPLATTTAMACVYVAAAWLFLSSLSAYKLKLRVAYTIIAVAIVMTALGALQLAVIKGFDLISSPWAQSGGVVLPFLLSGLALYVGTRNIARLIGVKTILTRVWLVVPATIALCLLAAFLPHPPINTPEIETDIANGILLWTGVCNLVAALVVFRIHRQIGAHYTNAMAWLFVALISGFVVVVLAFTASLLAGGTTGTEGVIDDIIDTLTIVAGFVYIKAGLALRKTREY